MDQTRRILLEGRKELNLHWNFHAEELSRLHSVEMGAHLGATAMSHLEEISPEGITAMAQSGSVAVVLPNTAFLLKLRPPPVREMIDQGIILTNLSSTASEKCVLFRCNRRSGNGF